MTDVSFETVDRIAVLRVRGSRLNIYRRATHEQLCRAMLRFLRDDDLHVAVIATPPGESWSAGDDVREFDTPFGDAPDWSEVLSAIPRDKPVIAAVRGHCLGQGFAHLLNLTDIRYAAPGAAFGFPEIKFGIGGAADLSGLTDVIPRTLARYLCLTGETLSAADAARYGLVNAVVADEDVERVAMETAGKIAAHALTAIRAEMSPVSRLLGGGDPYARAAQFDALWRMFQSSEAARDVEHGLRRTR